MIKKMILYISCTALICAFSLFIKVKYFGLIESSSLYEYDFLEKARNKHGGEIKPYRICSNKLASSIYYSIAIPFTTIKIADNKLTERRIGLCEASEDSNLKGKSYTLSETKINNLLNSMEMVGAVYYSSGNIIHTGDLLGIKEYRKSDQENLVQMGQLNEDINNYFAK